MKQRRSAWKVYAVSIAIALAVGGLAALLSHDSMQVFESLKKPPLAPPGVVFPIVWTILFLLMGISAARIYLSDSPERRGALTVYGLQLALNFGWTILFFCLQLYFAAFIWLIALIIAIFVMISRFYAIDRWAAYLQIPYLMWVLFAAYLNLAIAILNP